MFFIKTGSLYSDLYRRSCYYLSYFINPMRNSRHPIACVPLSSIYCYLLHILPHHMHLKTVPPHYVSPFSLPPFSIYCITGCGPSTPLQPQYSSMYCYLLLFHRLHYRLRYLYIIRVTALLLHHAALDLICNHIKKSF